MLRRSGKSSLTVAEANTSIGADVPFWEVPSSNLLCSLSTSEQGLTAEEAERRLGTCGRNEVAQLGRITALTEVVSFLLNPLVVILLVASAISVILGDVTDAGIIALIVLLSVVLNFFQAYRSQHASAALRDMVATFATVRRDGAWIEAPMAEVVPGDVVRLSAGDLVPGDARLLEARDLTINQSALTGESFPAEKAARAVPSGAGTRSLAEVDNAVFLGTSVISGSATAAVVLTGPATQFGQIGQRLRGRPAQTEFERGTRSFGLLITRSVAFLVIFVFLVNTLAHRGTLEAFLFAVALAVGLTPEFLPMIVSVTLAQGALRMARQKVIVKHLPSIENFGSLDILCTDKTGTITTGQVQVQSVVDWRGRNDPYVLRLAHVNSSLETGIKSPLDQAIMSSQPQPGAAATKIDEIPFDFIRRRLSVVASLDGACLLITKGAPESVMEVCMAYRMGAAAMPFDDGARAQAQSTFERLSAEGYRLLAVAYREVTDQAAYTAADERELVLAGFVAFVDPPKDTARSAIQALRADEVEIKIITGDNELVTRHVCRAVGLPTDDIVLGREISAVTDDALASLAERTSVFARVSPDQKNRIIAALKARGHVVGFLGDGINDAPSMRTADVGISVANAVDVAKEAADIILLEQSLEVLHRGVIEGRRSFGNITKYVLMGTSSNFGNMFSMAGATLFLPFLPMLPSQILLNNFLYDLSQVTIPTDKVDPTYLQKPKRWNVSFIQRFMLLFGPLSSVYDFLTFFVLLNLFQASEQLFHTGWFIESLATQTLVIFVIRTAGNPFKSRPSLALAVSVPVAVLAGLWLTGSPLAPSLGFAFPPPAFFLALLLLLLTYLGLVQLAKRWFYQRATL